LLKPNCYKLVLLKIEPKLKELVMHILKKIGFFCAFLLPVLVVWGYNMGGYWNYTHVIFVFILIPLLDKFIGKDSQNIEKEQIATLATEKYFRFVLYLWALVQTIFVIWACYVVSLSNFSSISYIGFLLSAALLTGGIGITVAHELGHKKEKTDRLMSQFLLMQVFYMHFYIEHNRGHHVRVATPEDPATSRKGETFYSFWWRSVTDGWQSAWHLETERLQRKGLNTWSLQNAMLWYACLPCLFYGLIIGLVSIAQGRFAFELPLFILLKSILGFSLLEVVNYIEHYGIVRRKTTTNKEENRYENSYERVTPLHSWNANELLSNLFLFQLQRHSDHHAYAAKPYQVLNHVETSPQLPAGYPAMILLALVPPLWFGLIDKRLEKWEEVRKKQQFA
jgi:alkane 1-monooxygenase